MLHFSDLLSFLALLSLYSTDYVESVLFPLVFLSPPGWLGSRCGGVLPSCQDINSHCWNGVCRCHSGFTALNGVCSRTLNDQHQPHINTITSPHESSLYTSAIVTTLSPQLALDCPVGWANEGSGCYPGGKPCPYGSYCTARKGQRGRKAVCCKPVVPTQKLCNGKKEPLFDAISGAMVECGAENNPCPLGYACQAHNHTFVCCQTVSWF